MDFRAKEGLLHSTLSHLDRHLTKVRPQPHDALLKPFRCHKAISVDVCILHDIVLLHVSVQRNSVPILKLRCMYLSLLCFLHTVDMCLKLEKSVSCLLHL